MNKYIKTDLEQAVFYMKAAIMNSLYDIDSGEERIDLGKYISSCMLYECLDEARWKHDDDIDSFDCWDYWISPSGKNCCIYFAEKCIIQICQ